MSFFQSIPELNGLSKGIAFAQMWKIAVCWKFQLIFQKKQQKRANSKFFVARATESGAGGYSGRIHLPSTQMGRARTKKPRFFEEN